MGGEVRWGDMAFQGKGFRSLGQEAIYAGAIRLKRGAAYKNADGSWNGDVMAPVIRDLGMTLAMRHDEEAVAMILRAQMGKAGPPMSGKDLHTGDFAWGVLPAAAPLAVGSLSMAGMAMAFCDPEERARRAVVHRRRRLVARRMARGDQRLRGGEAAGDLLPAEQPDRALDAGARQLRGARVRRQGRRLRHSRPDHRRHRSGRSRGGIHVGGRTRARGRGADAHRGRRDAHVRPRASRRHAVSRQGSAAVVGIPPAARHRLCESRALRVLGQARSDSDVCAAPGGRRRHRRARTSTR